MYSLPLDFDPGLLASKVVDYVTYARHTLALVFEDGTCLTIWGQLAIGSSPPQDATRFAELSGLPGAAVLRASSADRRELVLAMTTGVTLHVLNHPEFESYSLKFGEQVIIA